MATEVTQQCLSLLDSYRDVAREVSIRARFAAGLDPLRFGVQTGEISLQQLLVLHLGDRKAIVEQGLLIDWYLGDTRVYKRTTRTLLFAFCPDIGRHIVPHDGRFVVRLPQGFSNVLTVKLAVLYMEECMLSPNIQNVSWKVEDDIATYIYLAELFAVIGRPDIGRDVEGAILRRFHQAPLPVEQVRAIWGRDNRIHPSKYVEAMADNIMTFLCVPKLHLFALEHEIDPDQSYEDVVKKRMKGMKVVYPEHERRNNRRVRYETTILERLLASPVNLALKQLVWTANTLTPIEHADPNEWIEIRSIKERTTTHPHLAGVKKIVLARADQVHGGTGA